MFSWKQKRQKKSKTLFFPFTSLAFILRYMPYLCFCFNFIGFLLVITWLFCLPSKGRCPLALPFMIESSLRRNLTLSWKLGRERRWTMRKHTPCRVINHPILWRIDNLYYASPDRSSIGRGSLISRTYGVCTDSNRIQWGGELAYCVTGSLDGSWSPLLYVVWILEKLWAGQGGPVPHTQTHAPSVLGSDLIPCHHGDMMNVVTLYIYCRVSTDST